MQQSSFIYKITLSLLILLPSILHGKAISHVPWTFVGAGPSGIAGVGIALSHGIPGDQIAWLDPAFNVGALVNYRNVPGNATVQQYISFLKNCSLFDEIKSAALDRLYAMSPHETPELKYIVEPLQDITNYLLTKVIAIQDTMIGLDFYDNKWHITTKTTKFTSDNVVLATGAHPKTMHFHGIEHIPLDIALDKEKLATYIQPNDVVAVIGSAHSALLVVRHLTELPVTSIINFYKKPITYPIPLRDGIAWKESGLKGKLALWCKTVLEVNPPKNLIRIESTADNIQSLLPKCTKVIYAIGYERNELPAINGDALIYSNYDYSSGIIGPRLFGLGIAFPEQETDPLGNEEFIVGLPYLSFNALRMALNNEIEWELESYNSCNNVKYRFKD